MKSGSFYLLLIVLSIIAFASCKKSINQLPDPNDTNKKFEDLIIPQGFTWSTLNRSSFEVKIVDQNGEHSNTLNGFPLDVNDPNGNRLQRSSIIDGAAYFHLELNRGATKVVLSSPSLNINQEIDLTLENKVFVVPPMRKSTIEYTDSDGDGVYDEFDDFPDDSTRAYITYYPSPYDNSSFKSTGNSTVVVNYWQMFEDLWPAKGDYDLNDLVLKLRVEIYNNASNKWVGGKWEVTIWANGAGADLGCGIEFFNYMGTSSGKYRLRYLANDQVTLVPGTYDASITSLDPDVQNGVILFSNVDDAKPVDYWNTGVGISHEPVTVTFEYTLASQQNMMAGFLYLFRTANRGHEIRTFGIPPTTAANTALLGTGHDNSPTSSWNYTPGSEFLYPLNPPYYSTASLHPWGVEIEFAGNLRVALEQISIIDAFPQFAAWAESGGSMNKKWYENPDLSKTFNVSALIGTK